MKIKYFTIILLLSTNLLFSQSYIPMFVEGNQWNVMYYDESFGPDHPHDTWETIKYSVGDKVSKDGTNYIEIINDNGSHLYREDTAERKIYLRHETGDESWDELLYDFSMKMGDTLNYYRNQKDGEIHYTVRVDSIVNFELGNGFKTRKFYNSCKLGWEDEFRDCGNWIEGMGTFYGIYPVQKIGITGNHITKTLLCFKKNDELIYKNPDYKTCDENSDAINEIGYKRLKILPNPVNDHLSIELPEEELYENYLILDMLGKKVFSDKIITTNNLKIGVNNLKSGMYILRVEDIKGRIYLSKFVKQ